MSIDIVAQHAEKALLSELSNLKDCYDVEGVIHFQFSNFNFEIDEIEILQQIRQAFSCRFSKVYFCKDGDLFIAWNGEQEIIKTYIESSIQDMLKMPFSSNVSTYYSLEASIDNLKQVLQNKISERRTEKFEQFLTANAPQPPLSIAENASVSDQPAKNRDHLDAHKVIDIPNKSATPASHSRQEALEPPSRRARNQAAFRRKRLNASTLIGNKNLETHAFDSNKKQHGLASNISVNKAQVSYFNTALSSRTKRTEPEILIVEDQLFFNKLLQTILSDKYTVYSATKALKALDIYLKTAPDIVLLDIMLPDFDGHTLSSALMKLDPEAFIIMVTGHDDSENIKLAEMNGAKGFITKPYSTEKITEAVNKFKMEYRKSI